MAEKAIPREALCFSRQAAGVGLVPPEFSGSFRPRLPWCGDALRCILGAILLPGTRLTEIPMHLTLAKPLFAWHCLEDSPSLATVQTFLASIPDARLLDMLRRYRGRGRDDYPVHVLWGVLLLRVALRHVSIEATLGELSRNEGLGESYGKTVRVDQHVDLRRFPP